MSDKPSEGERLPVRAVLVDVDGVLVDGRPEDGRHWQTSIEADLGIERRSLDEFFARRWEGIVLGRLGLMDEVTTLLETVAPHVTPKHFIDYWFATDSRIAAPLLAELATVRATGVPVYLATNQEHVRAAWLMETLGLAKHVDGIFYSAELGTRKPEPLFFSKIEERLGLFRSELLLIDDSGENVAAATSAGWRALHWEKGSSPHLIHEVIA